MDLEIDGSYGEGGGQTLRTAAAMSLLTGRSFRITNIRAGRKKPGLKAQHLSILKILGRLADCRHSAADVGTGEVAFTPGPVRGGTFSFDVGTAGSITLILQAVLPAALFASGPTDLTLIGGTDVPYSMTFDYLRNVPLFPAVKCARRLDLEVESRGFFPKGGGRVRVRIVPEALGSPVREKHGPIELTSRGPLKAIRIFSVASESLRERKVAERQADSARKALARHGVRAAAAVEYAPSPGHGSALAAVAEFEGGARIGADALGARGKRAEEVGREAAEKLSREIASGAPVDVHAADNLVLWLALFGGRIRCSRISGHTRTNIWLVERFMDGRFRVDGDVISKG